MLHQGDIVKDSVMRLAKQKQEIEIDRLLAGGTAEVSPGEDHATSIWVLQMRMSSPQWDALSQEQRDAIQDHWAEHMDQQAALLGLQMNTPLAEQATGSAPATPPGQTPAPGAVGPEMTLTG